MSYPNLLENYSAAVQAEMRKSVIQQKEQSAPTRNSFKAGSGARGEAGRLAGLEIPFYQGVPHGSTALDPLAGTTSFEQFVAPTIDKMYVGLAFLGFTVENEHFHDIDGAKGLLPDDKFSQRDKVMKTYMWEQNCYAIGKGNGALAVVAAGGGGGSGTITFANDNTARGRSKGSIRLATSWSTTAGKRVMYESYTESTDTLTATFYITSKASATTAVIVVTDGGTVVAGDIVVKKGHYKKVPYGLGYHFDSSSRQYQGASTSTNPQLKSREIAAGSAAPTPTMIETAKLALDTRANDNGAKKKRSAHLTHGNYRVLGAYSYNLRTYNAEQGQANTSYGVPRFFEDEDTKWIEDANMEDAYIYMRDSVSYFEYRQSEMQEISKGETQYIGTNSRGSSEFYRNFGEAYNIAWDARGDDGKGSGEGAPNSSVVISGIAIPSVNQVSEGLSLV
jgi:hypothetical protein